MGSIMNCLSKNNCDVLPYSNNCNEVRAMLKHDKQTYNKAIDDFTKELKDYFIIPHDVKVIEMKAEQLKEGEQNE